MPRAKTKDEKLPKGWKAEEWDERRAALDLLSPARRKLLAFEWTHAAVADARRVLPIFEKERPGDNRPRLAIQAAEKTIETGAANAANAAAYAAANAANAYAAAHAAYAAANAYAAADPA